MNIQLHALNILCIWYALNEHTKTKAFDYVDYHKLFNMLRVYRIRDVCITLLDQDQRCKTLLTEVIHDKQKTMVQGWK